MLKGIIPLNFNMITQGVKKTDAVLTLKVPLVILNRTQAWSLKLKHERVPLESSQTL